MTRRSLGKSLFTGRAFFVALAFFSLFFSRTAPVYAVEAGTRAFGMGGAFTGVADDATAAFWNPAGITQIRYVGLLSSLGVAISGADEWQKAQKWFDEGLQPPLPTIHSELEGVYGKSVATARYAFSHGAYTIGTAAVADYSVGLDLRTYGFTSLTLAYPFGRFLPAQVPFRDYFQGLAVGANLKFVGSGYAGGSRALEMAQVNNTAIPVKDTQTTVVGGGYGFGTDLGVFVPLTPKIAVGATIRDLYTRINWSKTEDITIIDEVAGTSSGSHKGPYQETEVLKPSFRTGLAFRPWKGMTLAADHEGQNAYSHSAAWHLGVEQKLLFDVIALRAGEVIRADGVLSMQTIGIGLKIGPFMSDLAAASSDGFVGSINAQGSLGFQF
ncbi:MAG: hypothetical protein M1379_00060 [Firmicutes bacterium]|nr:hypothetical protein [Bacillota bacterium]